MEAHLTIGMVLWPVLRADHKITTRSDHAMAYGASVTKKPTMALLLIAFSAILDAKVSLT